MIVKHTGVTPPELPPPPVMEDYGTVEMAESATLLNQLEELFPGDGIASDSPDVMEEYGQSCAAGPPLLVLFTNWCNLQQQDMYPCLAESTPGDQVFVLSRVPAGCSCRHPFLSKC